MDFPAHLARYGPGASYNVSPEQARAYCAELAATHYENFHVVTLLTPRELRPHFASIYTFCRWADDLGDEVGDRQRARDLLAWWRGELRALYDGRAQHPVMVALAETVAEFGIPIDPFEALITAFEQDQEVTDYDTYDQLLDYCTRSANPVGHLVLYLGRSYTAENARLADLTCTGLQLANHWQDVARDLTNLGRVYLPREDRAHFGVADDDLQARRFTPQFAALMRFEVDRARDLLLRGWPLVERMPRALAVDVDLFTRGGLAILDRIERRGYDVLSRRPEVGKLAKLGLLGRAILGQSGLLAPRARLRPAEESAPEREGREFFLPLPGGEGRGEGRPDHGGSSADSPTYPLPGAEGTGRPLPVWAGTNDHGAVGGTALAKGDASEAGP